MKQIIFFSRNFCKSFKKIVVGNVSTAQYIFFPWSSFFKSQNMTIYNITDKSIIPDLFTGARNDAPFSFNVFFYQQGNRITFT